MKIVVFDVLLPKAQTDLFPVRLQPHEFLDHLAMDEVAIFVFVATHLRRWEAAQLQFDASSTLGIIGPQYQRHLCFIISFTPASHFSFATIVFFLSLPLDLVAPQLPQANVCRRFFTMASAY